MPIALLMCLGLLAGPEDADPDDDAARIQRLASSDAAERLEAAGQLEDRGRAALPALYKARASANEARREPIGLLINLIEHNRLKRATPVRLEAENLPLREIVGSLRDQTAFDLKLDVNQELSDRRLTLHTPTSVPFWSAVDLLTKEGGLQIVPGGAINPLIPGRDLRLVPKDGEPPPADTTGPFRVVITRIARSRSLRTTRGPSQPTRFRSFSVDLNLLAEPGLWIRHNGAAILQEAIDDRGQDLRGTGDEASGLMAPMAVVTQRNPFLSFRIALAYPDTPGTMLRRLRGFLPVTVLGWTGESIEIALKEALGESIATPDGRVKVESIKSTSPRSTQIDLAFEANDALAPRGRGRYMPLNAANFQTDRNVRPLGDFAPPFRVEEHLELLDAGGNPVVVHGQFRSPGTERTPALLTLVSQSAKEPTTLRYHGVVATAIEIVFDFKEIPIP